MRECRRTRVRFPAAPPKRGRRDAAPFLRLQQTSGSPRGVEDEIPLKFEQQSVSGEQPQPGLVGLGDEEPIERIVPRQFGIVPDPFGVLGRDAEQLENLPKA